MRKALTVCLALAIALCAVPAMATHPNYIDFVLVTDVTALENPDSAQANQLPVRLVDDYNGANGMYPPEWGGEYIGEAGSQAGWHYVDNLGRGRGAWFNKTVPSPSAPVVLEFDLRQVYDVNQICIWNVGSQAADNWFIDGARDVTVKVRKAPWEEWTEYGDLELAPVGWLRGTRPDDLYIGHNSNAWGTYRVSNQIVSSNPATTEQPIADGAIFDTYYYPEGGMGANLDPIPVDFQARFVRFEITSNWGGLGAVGMSEVRFYKDGPGLYIDVDPNPAYSGSYVDPENNLRFGDSYRNWTKPQNIIVYNLGTSAAEVTGASVTGPFGLDTASMPVNLSPVDGIVYDETTLQALFSPTMIGDQSGSIDIEYSTAAGDFAEQLNVSGVGKDVAFGYIPYAVADATQYGNPWWGGWTAQHAVNGLKTLYNANGAPHMIEDLGEFVFGSKNAKEEANNGESWRTQPYPNYGGVGTVEEITFTVDLGGALGGGEDIVIGNSTRGPNQGAAVASHDVSEIRIWNFTMVTNGDCEAAIRSVKFEYSGDEDAASHEDVTDWTQWGNDIEELEKPEPGVDSPPTDILDVTDIGAPIRFWRFTTLGLAAGAPGPNYGHANTIGLGQIRFYTSKANVAITPVGNDFGNLAPYESVDAPEVTIENVGTDEVIIQSVEWDGDHEMFEMVSAPAGLPATLGSGDTLGGLVVNFQPKLYGSYMANAQILVIDNSDPNAEEKPENLVTLVYQGSCLAMENGFIPVDHAWASSSWDANNWSPNWTHAANGRSVHEMPAGLWGSRDMEHDPAGGSKFMWHARQPGSSDPNSAWIAWDFGETKELYDMLVWNAMRTCCNGSYRGMRKVKIQYTTDAPPSNASDWGPWGPHSGAAVPIDYTIGWDGLNWLELTPTILAAYPQTGGEGNVGGSTPNAWYPASNQLNGNPIEFRGRQARLVRIMADGASWADWYANGEADGWAGTPQNYHFCLAEARFYGPSSAAVYDVTEYDFGSVEVGGSATMDITVTNLESATQDLNVDGLFVEDRSGADATSPYSVTGPTGSIAPGDSATFTVTFAPSAAGDYNSFESVILNDSPRNGLMLTSLMGTGYEAGSSDILLGSDSIDFGQRFLQLGTQSVPLMIKNMGDTALTVDFAFDPSDVFGTTQEGQLTVDAFGEAEVWVSVTPQALGMAEGTMTLTTNDPDEGTVVVPLTVDVANASAASVEGASWVLYE